MKVRTYKEQFRHKEEDTAAAKAAITILLGITGASILIYLTRGPITRLPILTPEEQ